MSAQLGPRLPLARAKLSDADAVLAFAVEMGTIASGAMRQQRTSALLKIAWGALEFSASGFNPYSFSQEEFSRQPRARETSGALNLLGAVR